MTTIKTDVLIIGSGPIGATFARKLVENGIDVIMVDAGPQRSPIPGEHLKNAYLYQKDRTNFSYVVRSELYPLSIPTQNVKIPNLDPSAFWASKFVRNNMNPKQDPNKNMPSGLAAFAVGGMGIHWTCATPRFRGKELEGLEYITDLDVLYKEAEHYFGTSQQVFKASKRGRIIKDTLDKHYGNEVVDYLPVAARRREDMEAFVHWTGPADILGPLANSEIQATANYGKFQILPNCIVTKLCCQGGKITHAEVQSFQQWEKLEISAGTFVVAASAIKTPQLLYNSGIRHPALGHYLTEHIMAFSQIVLSKEIIEKIKQQSNSNDEPRYFSDFEELYHVTGDLTDPVPVPLDDPDPTLWIPVQEDRPWHCQIHKDNFSYGQVADNIDDRLVIDLRWFGFVHPNKNNYVKFEDEIFDIHGLPQPTFNFEYREEDVKDAHRMMDDMTAAALSLGGFLPDSPPQFLPAGSSLHYMGTYRMGEEDKTSVVDPYSKVWGFNNLYLGGPGVIPTANGANPTLTAAALAIRAAQHIINSKNSGDSNPKK